MWKDKAMTTLINNNIGILNPTAFASALGSDIARSAAKFMANDHPVMNKIKSIQINLVLSHLSGQYVQIEEKDLTEVVIFLSDCRKASGADTIPRNIAECHELLHEGIITPHSQDALRPFNQDARLRDELRDAQDRMSDAHFLRQLSSPEEQHPMLFPTITAWDYDHVVLEVSENHFRLMDWRSAVALIENATSSYNWA